MGRSKFPGKPAKHVHKKRVTVLPCSSSKINDTSTGYNEFSDTLRNNVVHSDTKQADKFVKQCSEEQNVDIKDEKTNMKCSLPDSNLNGSKMTLKDNQINTKIQNSESLSILLRNNKSSAFLYNYTNYTLKNDAITKSRSIKTMNRLMRKSSEINLGKVSESNRKTFYVRKRQKAKVNKTNSTLNPTSSRHNEKETTSLVGKFVLPSRSLHSSRVIIPNKRFLNNESPPIHSNNNSVGSSNTNSSTDCLSKTSTRRTKMCDKNSTNCNNSKLKKSVVFCDSAFTDSSKLVNDTVRKNNEQQQIICRKSGDSNNSKCASDGDRVTSDNSLTRYIESTSTTTLTSTTLTTTTISSSTSSSTSWSCGKLVLRKARLQLHNNQSSASGEGGDGPFSSYSSSTTTATTTTTASANPPGTVTCGVCGAVRFYRFVKQARKFNIYSCESCRKFISKMIKRQTCAKNCALPTLVCHKGQGMCHVPPIVRSQQWKLIRCAYKARCPACWLKMCLRSFQMPAQLKINLINMLPENMRSAVSTTTDSVDMLITTNERSSLLQQQIPNGSMKNKEKIVRVLDSLVSPLKLDILSSKTDTLLSNIQGKRTKKSARLKIAKKNLHNSSISSSSSSSMTGLNTVPLNITPDSTSTTKRQKLDLKGPRVKHVCRSASIVLGQPLATFPSDTDDNNKEKTNKTEVCDTLNPVDSLDSVPSPLSTTIPSSSSSSVFSSVSASIITCASCNQEISEDCNNYKSDIMKEYNNEREMTSIATNNCVISQEMDVDAANSDNEEIKNALKPLIKISANYLDICDSGGKILNNGFGLIGSEPFPIQAVCFYCGSVGHEQLIYCACCCEPYHYYCVNDNIVYRYLRENVNVSSSRSQLQWQSQYANVWNIFWICSRCTICYHCGNAEKQKVPCQLCRQYFHFDCIQSQNKSPDKPMICSSCLYCEDCGSKNIVERICNVCLCLPCFTLQTKNKMCPICEKRGDHVNNSKMLKCAQCKSLVHAHCEKLSEELFYVFAYLPSSFNFICSTCTSSSTDVLSSFSHWKYTFSMILNNGFHIILRLLSNSRTSNELVKWNLMKNRFCSCRVCESKKNIASTNNSKRIAFNVDEASKQIDNDDVSVSSKKNQSVSFNISNTNSSDITAENFDNNSFDLSIKNMRKKFSIKECSVRIRNCAETKLKNNHTSSTVKLSKNENDDMENVQNKNDENPDNENNKCRNCKQQELESMSMVSLLNIKKKIYGNFYKSVREFHFDVKQTLKQLFCHDLLQILDTLITDTFPWYKSTESIDNDKIENVSISEKSNDNKSIDNAASCDINIDFNSALLETSSTKRNLVYDTRKCTLCGLCGDAIPSMEGRLLYCGLNEWVHINCAFWSDNVYEELDCSLQNLHETFATSRTSLCTICKKLGASISCTVQNCNQMFHYKCARKEKCIFFKNKTISCSSHGTNDALQNVFRNSRDFEMQRPVFIDIDRRKTRYIELSKIQFLIGALNVTNFGTLYPPLSDTEEAIIPSEFVCSRLFWSTEQPGKITKYTISTSILMPSNFKHPDNFEKNFTVDHSLEREQVEKKFTEIYKWNKELENGKTKKHHTNNNNNSNTTISSPSPSSPLHTENTHKKKDSVNITDDDKVVLQVLEHVLELICSKEVEENCDDEPQNTADLLPPELKEAIFEDLPHDLLDGISMQDIFPKLMSYEDILSMDFKNSDANDLNCGAAVNTDFITKDNNKSDMVVNHDAISDVDFWLEPKYSIQNLDDYVQNSKIGQELKRSKSEVLPPGIKKFSRTRNHQRSCSLTWSCKLDNSNMKKRKVSCTSKSVADISNNLFMVVDGTGDMNMGNKTASMLQELRLPDGGVLMTVGRSTNVDCIDTVRELKYRLEENSVLSTSSDRDREIEQGKENKCRIWHNCNSNNNNRSQSRILQVDGADDTSSASDSESVTCDYQIMATTMPQQYLFSSSTSTTDTTAATAATVMSSSSSSVKNSDEPVKCDRCQCTYRTHSSYKRHLLTCDFITSESDSDVSLANERCVNIDEFEPNHSTVSHLDTLLLDDKLPDNTHSKISNHLSISQSEESSINTSDTITHLTQTSVNSAGTIPQNHLNIIDNSSQIITVTTQSTNNIQKNDNINHHNIEIAAHSTTSHIKTVEKLPLNVSITNSIQMAPQQQQQLKMPISKVAVAVQKQKSVRQRPISTNKTNRNKNKNPKTLCVKRIRTDKTINIAAANNQNHINGSIIANGSSGPTVIIQHLPSPNMMPAYVEAFQHQTGQNLQCIATILPSEFKQMQVPVPLSVPAPTPTPVPYIATPTNSFVPGTGTFHLTAAESNGFSVLSSNQTSHPTVMGTLIQQSRPTATIQCGMMASAATAAAEQLVLGSVPTIDTTTTIVTDPSGSMYFSTQPVYYGFETIVQNTVMSSQQFVSTALPGVLASNSSYSATTTQVFQASKLEPIVDLNGTGYVLVNSTVPQLSTAPITITSHPGLNSVPTNRSTATSNLLTTQQQQIIEAQSTPISVVQTVTPAPASTPMPTITSIPATIPTPVSLPMTNPAPPTTISVPTSISISVPQTVPSQSNYSIQISPICDSIVPTIEQQPVIYSELQVQAAQNQSQFQSQSQTQIHINNTEQIVPQIKTTPVVNSIEPSNIILDVLSNSNNTINTTIEINSNNVNTTTTTGNSANTINGNGIILPVAPYAAENKIPMNIVNPIPQVSNNGTTQISRPMNRVLPMQTAPPQNREGQKTTFPAVNNKIVSLEPPGILNKLSETVDKIQESLKNNDTESVNLKHNINDNQMLKLESASLKLVFQKQSQDGIYKISNKYISKNNVPIQITPMKQNKSTKMVETIVNVKNISSLDKKKDNNVHAIKETVSPLTHNNKNITNVNNNISFNNKIKSNNTAAPNILYKIHSQDGYDYSSTSITELWQSVFEAVQSARAAHNIPLLPENAFNIINGLQLLGLNTNGLRYLIEQLPGADNCVKYKPVCLRKSKNSQNSVGSGAPEDEKDENKTFRAARCEPTAFIKQPYDMFSWLASRHRNPEYYAHQFDSEYASRRSSSVNLPMAMRFRQLKETSKYAVGVYRSNIHGRGLFCLRDIECGEMVIEYAGEVIRSTLTDKREKFYNSKGIGCYMFRVDDNFVIDATMKGNAARFINHSCDPNCYSRVLDILGHKHILIFALRKIIQGEELTYDYKFPFEEDKIPCTCGAKRCRKYLN